MNRKLAIVLFVATALLQAAAPLSMIARREAVLRHGAQFRFKTAPVDPCDAMRGRYVALGIRPDTAPKPEGGQTAAAPGQKVYALLGRDAEGFADITRLVTRRPVAGDFLAVRMAGEVYGQEGMVHIDLPFDRYYMEESMAPRAESLYAKQAAGQDGEKAAYVTVRIKNGLGVIENLYIGGRRIEDALKEQE